MAFLEARFGTRVVTTLFTTGIKVLPRRQTMLLKAWSARRFTLLFLSVSRGLKASNTCGVEGCQAMRRGRMSSNVERKDVKQLIHTNCTFQITSGWKDLKEWVEGLERVGGRT